MTDKATLRDVFGILDEQEITEADVEIKWKLVEHEANDGGLSAMCCVCHRKLRNLKSQQRGMGPVCARKAGGLQLKLL